MPSRTERSIATLLLSAAAVAGVPAPAGAWDLSNTVIIQNNTAMRGRATMHNETTEWLDPGGVYRHTSYFGSTIDAAGRDYHIWLDFGTAGKCAYVLATRIGNNRYEPFNACWITNTVAEGVTCATQIAQEGMHCTLTIGAR
ncbi:MAG: hypothetical protein AB7P02_27120 [Alphaproteobacteria bacterium]